MVISFAGSNTIKDETSVKRHLRKLLSFYSDKEYLTVLCASANRFDEIVFETALEVREKTIYPIRLVAVALDVNDVKSHALTALCDEVRYYTGRFDKSAGKETLWVDESNMLIVFLEKAEKSNASAYYRYALDNDVPTINIAAYK